jgi:hypothetical protein
VALPFHPRSNDSADDAAKDSGVQLEEAARIVERVASSLVNGDAHLAPRMLVVRPRQRPPPGMVGRSCVYLCRRPDGFMYCGQTDDVHGAGGPPCSQLNCV